MSTPAETSVATALRVAGKVRLPEETLQERKHASRSEDAQRISIAERTGRTARLCILNAAV